MKRKKCTILVVDDSPRSRNHLIQIMFNDYIVMDASGGVGCIE